MKKDKLIKLRILAGFTVVFSLLVCFVDRAPIGPEGTSVGLSSINGAVHALTGVQLHWYDQIGRAHV